MSSRLAWCTEQVPREPGLLYKEPLSHKTKKEKKKKRSRRKRRRRRTHTVAGFYTPFSNGGCTSTFSFLYLAPTPHFI